jgi:hypothetical protein
MEPTPIGRRAILKKAGHSDVSVEVRQNVGGSFSCRVDGSDGAIWPKYSPEQTKRGDTRPMTLDDAWRSVLSKYPDYEVTASEDAFPVTAA